MSTKTEAFAGKVLDAVARKDHAAIAELIGDGAVMHTPRFLRPLTDRRHILTVLQGIVQVLPDFAYERWWVTEHEAIMQFTGHVAGTNVIAQGLDIFTVAEDGRFTELTVFLRPTKALEAIGTIEDAWVRGQLAGAAAQG